MVVFAQDVEVEIVVNTSWKIDMLEPEHHRTFEKENQSNHLNQTFIFWVQNVYFRVENSQKLGEHGIQFDSCIFLLNGWQKTTN